MVGGWRLDESHIHDPNMITEKGIDHCCLSQRTDVYTFYWLECERGNISVTTESGFPFPLIFQPTPHVTSSHITAGCYNLESELNESHMCWPQILSYGHVAIPCHYPNTGSTRSKKPSQEMLRHASHRWSYLSLGSKRCQEAVLCGSWWRISDHCVNAASNRNIRGCYIG